MSEKRTKAEKLQQQIEKAEREMKNLSDETTKKEEDANEATIQVVRTVTHSS
jgi:hypothetical protein